MGYQGVKPSVLTTTYGLCQLPRFFGYRSPMASRLMGVVVTHAQCHSQTRCLCLGDRISIQATFASRTAASRTCSNLNTLEWSRKYSWDDYEDYRRPSVVSDAIEGADRVESTVQVLFDTTYRTERQVWYPYAAPTPVVPRQLTATTRSLWKRPLQEKNAGAIAGGIVGGVAVLVIGCLVSWFCRPYRRAATRSRNSTAWTETTLGASAVSRWLRCTNFNEPPQREPGMKEGSDTDGTSNKDHVVPAAHARPATGLDRHAELYGDQSARHEMSSTDDGFSPRSTIIVENMSRTRHASVEAGSQRIHEMLDESSLSPRQSTQKPELPYMWQAEKATFGSIDKNSGSAPQIPPVDAALSSRPVIQTKLRRAQSRARPSTDTRKEREQQLSTSPPSRQVSSMRMSAHAAGPISPM